MDCVVNVGLGTGTRERDMAALGVIATYQEKIITAFGRTTRSSARTSSTTPSPAS